ncbi:41447_t:CDS:2, partial [Gigaspora margarita]
SDASKHKQKFEELKQGKPEHISYYDSYTIYNLDKYDKEIKELEDYEREVAEKSNKIRSQTQKEQRDKESELNSSHCSYCNYKYNKKQKDGQKFCSDNCYYQHYAEKCDDCLEKCVSSYKGKATGYAQTYYSDAKNKTGILCSKCHQEQLKEETEERKKDKE